MSLATRISRRRQATTTDESSSPLSSLELSSPPASSSTEIDSYFGALNPENSVTDRFLMMMEHMARPMVERQPHHPISQFFKMFGKRMARDIRKLPEETITNVTKAVVADWARVVYPTADYVLVPLGANDQGGIRALETDDLLALAKLHARGETPRLEAGPEVPDAPDLSQ